MSENQQTSHTNRLAREVSPYLLQHQHNPVDWWAWGPDALAEAKQSGKPILLSVGYAACHWCHVMAHESFEDEATARVMNELFVNIKVDREERPDIDQIYMHALQLIGDRGGWPLTMFLNSDGEPIWGGTYFPNQARYGRPAFVDVLKEFARLYREEPDKLANNRNILMGKLAAIARPQNKIVIGLPELDQAAASLGRRMDHINGGLEGAPKFPSCQLLEFLWRTGLRRNDPRFFDLVELTLTHICEGGIYDHLGGGFARYSVDAEWLVPHFEKMLYDNAQLLELLGLAYVRSGKTLYRTRAFETVGWLTREMTTPEGAFSASLDADSEGEEGKFYVWKLKEVEDILGPEDTAFFAAHYNVTKDGNFEGHDPFQRYNILNRLKDLPRSIEDEERLAGLRAKLFAVREGRIRPGLDDKVLADWNGLMIAALANAGILFDTPEWLAIAKKAFDAVILLMGEGAGLGSRLGHSWRAGKLTVPGLASDYANMGRAALALYEATGEGRYLDHALTWQSTLDAHYFNPETARYFFTADDAPGLVVRPQSTFDDAAPNPNGVIAQNLLRLAALTGDDLWRGKADAMLDDLLPLAAENIFNHISPLSALDMRMRLADIVVTGDGAVADVLITAALKIPYLIRTVLRAPSAARLPNDHPAREKVAASAGAAAFVCVGETCSLPVTSAEAIAEAVTSATAAQRI